MANSAVRFIEGGSGILSLLEIESEHCTDPAAAISGLLFELRVQIVRSETRTEEQRVLSRLQLVEFDGGRIDDARRREIQSSVRAMIERPRGLRQARPATVARALLSGLAGSPRSLATESSRVLHTRAIRPG